MTRDRISRRRFVQTGLCGLAVGAGAAWPLFRESSAQPSPPRIRPPGALEGDAFHAACVRCGLCVQACPYDALRLSGRDGTRQAGTPYFVAREIPCEMCADAPCVRACPTGALEPGLEDIRDARMGVASLSDPRSCNSFTGAGFCKSCYLACPLQDEAITMVYGPTKMKGLFTPVVNPDVCTGCGKCEKACIAESAAITVKPGHA